MLIVCESHDAVPEPIYDATRAAGEAAAAVVKQVARSALLGSSDVAVPSVVSSDVALASDTPEPAPVPAELCGYNVSPGHLHAARPVPDVMRLDADVVVDGGQTVALLSDNEGATEDPGATLSSGICQGEDCIAERIGLTDAGGGQAIRANAQDGAAEKTGIADAAANAGVEDVEGTVAESGSTDEGVRMLRAQLTRPAT